MPATAARVDDELSHRDSGRLWRGQTPDAREADRRERLVEAGLELVGTGGAPSLTMRAACRAAGVGPRYFYDVFDSREDLLGAVYDETVDRIRQPILADVVVAAEKDGLAVAILTAFDTAVAVVEADPRIGRILFRESSADDTLRPRSQAAVPVFVLSIVEAVLPDRAAELRTSAGAWTVVGFSAAVFALFLAWSEGVRHTSRDEFVHHCASFAVDHLGLGVDLSGAGDWTRARR